jgi:integral membrane sensor domain MASE1
MRGEAIRMTLLRGVEAASLAGLLILTSAAVFFRPSASVTYPFESPYVLFPLFIWAAARFELRGGV